MTDNLPQGEHLDLDALADALAEQAPAPAVAHLRACPACSAALVDLEAATVPVVAALATLPEPEPPADLADRLQAAVARERRALTAPAAATVTPLAPRTKDRTRLLPWAGGVAAAAVLVTGGLLLTRGGSDGSDSAPTSAMSGTGLVRNDTGTDYRKDGKALTAALPVLLGGSGTADVAGAPEAAASAPGALAASGSQNAATGDTRSGTRAKATDALAGLRTTGGLASCLSALTDPDVEGLPLAIDYAAFEGKPALVVVLPSTRENKVDVFVVGAGCTPVDAQVLLFTRLTRPG